MHLVRFHSLDTFFLSDLLFHSPVSVRSLISFVLFLERLSGFSSMTSMVDIISKQLTELKSVIAGV